MMTQEKITAATRLVVSQDQLSCNLAGEAAILNLKNSVYYGLDPIGARLWDLIQTPTSVAAVRNALLREYDVSAERCEKDLVNLLGRLAAEGLIEIEDAVSFRAGPLE